MSSFRRTGWPMPNWSMSAFLALHEGRRALPRDAAEHHGGEEPVAGEIARSLGPADAAGGATGGEKVRNDAASREPHACRLVHRQAALAVEQRAGDAHRAIGRGEWCGARPVAPE